MITTRSFWNQYIVRDAVFLVYLDFLLSLHGKIANKHGKFCGVETNHSPRVDVSDSLLFACLMSTACRVFVVVTV